MEKQYSASDMRHGISRFSDHDIYLFKEGNHFRLFDKLGAHPMNVTGTEGTYFALWAPNAEKIAVTGDFNSWDGRRHGMRSLVG